MKATDIIEDYDDLRTDEITALLPELYDDELELVRDYELAGKNRRTIVDMANKLLSTQMATTRLIPPPPKPDPVVELPTREECIEKGYELLQGAHPNEYGAQRATVANAWLSLAREIRADDEKFERLRESLQDHGSAESHN